MPQYNTPTGSYAYPDSKSTFPTAPRVSFGRAVAIGLSAGLFGAILMAGSNKVEQFITNRPNSYVPARTLANLLGVTPSFYAKHTDLLNHIHHNGMGMLAGTVRAAMSYYGIIGPFASFVHTGVRLFMDQIVENSAGVSAPPWTWPISEQVIDISHKLFYSMVTGYLCDYYIRGVNWFNV
ncbi:hypothetical protein DM02DRAFT_692108 [Periconia macrospinosa]|uniref:Uncharacterized protein n=1 Tax=Periconia macrospinosa TaxID=97972 RepID=A0A2V1E2D9_9PLEO|nr:hypothetical protein DM02DRAFT_692108 [Periconia macrospinosa]